MDNKLNVQKLGYEVGEPMWVHWDDRYVLRGGHILGKCPDENLITTVGYLAYMDDKSIILGRGIENHCDEDGTRRVKDTIHIPMSLVASFLHLRLGGLRQCALTYSHLPRRNLIINNKART